MDDLISREEAIRRLTDQRGLIEEEIKDIINNLPSAERHGRWINSWIRGVHHYKCSECGEYTEAIWHANFEYKYCPNCGAKMDGKEEENED